jgi:hypothetical protein
LLVKKPLLPQALLHLSIGLLACGFAACSTAKDQGHGDVVDMAQPTDSPDFAWAPPVVPKGDMGGDVAIGSATPPTVQYNAVYNGAPVNVAWTVDKGEIATVQNGPASSTVVAPKGAAAGTVTLTAGFNGGTVKRTILVKLSGSQSGYDPNNPATSGQVAPSDPTKLNPGGGVGGVGGEGLGGAPGEPSKTALGTPGDPTTVGLTWLYPYDKTVFPRGMLAPLLMWRSSLADADAIQIKLSNDAGTFSWTGQFGRPAVLGPTGAFIRHPIPQDVWDMATKSSGGASNKLTISLVIAKGDKAYGPISETWTVAPGRLSGMI